jgi:hypothetical protein
MMPKHGGGGGGLACLLAAPAAHLAGERSHAKDRQRAAAAKGRLFLKNRNETGS